jgi:hypothetical protein
VHQPGKPESRGHLRQRFFAHQARAQLGQPAFGELREARVELVGHGASEDAVAQEFEPLVVRRAEAAVGQRLLKEAGVGEPVPEARFEVRFPAYGAPFELAA